MNRLGWTILLGALAATAAPARAQFGWGNYGWGGWGGGTTAPGNIASGLGDFAVGAGRFNLDTAQARSIDTDTLMRWNQFVYESQRANTANYWARRRLINARNTEALATVQNRLTTEPTAADVRSGDALNAALLQLANPRLKIEAGRISPVMVDSKLVRDIPFQRASEGLTFSLQKLSEDARWPAALQAPAFAPLVDKLQEQVAAAREEHAQADRLSPATLEGLAATVAAMHTQVDALPRNLEHRAADRYLRGLGGLVRMLRDPDITDAIARLDKVETVNVANLLGFMQLYNLRFGVATMPRQIEAYQQLFPAVDRLRDEILAGLGAEAVAAAEAPPAEDPAGATEVFAELPWERIEGQPPAAPAPK